MPNSCFLTSPLFSNKGGYSEKGILLFVFVLVLIPLSSVLFSSNALGNLNFTNGALPVWLLPSFVVVVIIGSVYYFTR